MSIYLKVITTLAVALLALSACSDSIKVSINTKGEAQAPLYIISPQDGEAVTSPVTVRFGLSTMGVAPAGVLRDNTGHHHLIIDAPLPDLKNAIPASDNYIHFGGGQTETTIDLEPGKHTLQLLLGNAYHIPHDQPLISKVITINVVE